METTNLPADPALAPGLRRLWPVWGLLVVGVWVAFAPALGNGFVDWDDRQWIVENDAFRGLGRDQVRFAFTTFTGGVYQPIGWLVQSLTYEGLRPDPRGYCPGRLPLPRRERARQTLCAWPAGEQPDLAAASGGVLGWSPSR